MILKEYCNGNYSDELKKELSSNNNRLLIEELMKNKCLIQLFEKEYEQLSMSHGSSFIQSPYPIVFIKDKLSLVSKKLGELYYVDHLINKYLKEYTMKQSEEMENEK